MEYQDNWEQLTATTQNLLLDVQGLVSPLLFPEELACFLYT